MIEISFFGLGAEDMWKYSLSAFYWDNQKKKNTPDLTRRGHSNALKRFSIILVLEVAAVLQKLAKYELLAWVLYMP